MHFIRNFTPLEIDRFRINDPTQTVCGITAYTGVKRSMVTFANCHLVGGAKHAEVVAFETIKSAIFRRLLREWKSRKYIFLEFCICLNYSPCSACRDEIFKYIEMFQECVPRISIRITLFFSFFNRELGSRVNLKNWIIKLLNIKVTVLTGPIILSKVHRKLSAYEKNRDGQVEVKFIRFINLLDAGISVSNLTGNGREIKLKVLSRDSLIISIYQKDHPYYSQLIPRYSSLIEREHNNPRIAIKTPKILDYIKEGSKPDTPKIKTKLRIRIRRNQMSSKRFRKFKQRNARNMRFTIKSFFPYK